MVFPGNGKRGGTIEVSTIGERYAVCKVFCQPAFRNQSGANLKPMFGRLRKELLRQDAKGWGLLCRER
jgi:hypothetical protein